MMDEYDKIVQDEMQRAKNADKETNNNIRDNYMRNLGVHQNRENDRFTYGSTQTGTTPRGTVTGG